MKQSYSIILALFLITTFSALLAWYLWSSAQRAVSICITERARLNDIEAQAADTAAPGGGGGGGSVEGSKKGEGSNK